MRRRWLGLALALMWCLTAARGAGAQAMDTAAPDLGLVIGVSAIARPDPTQLDGTRNIRVYTYLYNDSALPQHVDWRTRRLRSHKLTCTNSDLDYYGTFVVAPGEVVFMKSWFYYKVGVPGKFVFSVRDDSHLVYSVPVAVQATNRGPFSKLPATVQQHLIDAFLAHRDFKWWYKQY